MMHNSFLSLIPNAHICLISFVRYADDFKIFCPTHAEAVKVYKATEMWLKDRLGLDISPDKSKVVNLKRQYSDFLGF